MADEIDDAQEMSELHLTRSLERIKNTTVAYSGFCLFCGDDCGKDRRYCDSYCREDHEKQIKTQRLSPFRRAP